MIRETVVAVCARLKDNQIICHKPKTLLCTKTSLHVYGQAEVYHIDSEYTESIRKIPRDF